MLKVLLILGVSLSLLGCKPPDPVVKSTERALEVTDAKFTKHSWFSFRDIQTGERFNKVSVGKYCQKGKRWGTGTKVWLTVVTYQGSQGQYQELPRSEARRMCR